MENIVPLVICGTVAFVAFVVLCVVALLRNEVRDWMRRVTGIGPQGVQLAPPDQQQQVTADAERVQPRDLPQPPGNPPTPALAPWQAQIEARIELQNLKNSPRLVDELKHALAIAFRANDFLITTRHIFGTQISALTHLTIAPKGLTLADLQFFFEQHQVRVRATGAVPLTDILLWVNYLITRNLVTYENSRYRITPAGRDFLTLADQLGVNATAAY